MIRPLYSGLLSNQGEKSINFYFIMVPLRKKVLKYGTPKPSGTVERCRVEAKVAGNPKFHTKEVDDHDGGCGAAVKSGEVKTAGLYSIDKTSQGIIATARGGS